MKNSWPQVALLTLYILGCLGSLLINTPGSQPIAYMLAGAAANASMMGAIKSGTNDRKE